MLDANQAQLLALDSAPIVVAVMRNELKRLPRWFEHYRSLGIRQFVIVNNNSSDGTDEYLSSRPDVIVIQNNASFADANYGMDWVNAVRAYLAPSRWMLFADADEYLVYENWPDRNLPTMLSGVSERCNAVTGFMLDMYPKGDIAKIAPHVNLVRTCRYFDKHYVFRTRPKKPWASEPSNLEVIGGPRVRLLSSARREFATTWVDYFVRGQIDRLLALAPARLRRFLIERYPATIPALKKTPLTRGWDTRYTNNHDVAQGRYHTHNVVLLHYKFTNDFAEKVKAEAIRGQHYRFGAEYILYQKYMLDQERLVLFSDEESLELRNIDDLVSSGLIRDISNILAATASQR